MIRARHLLPRTVTLLLAASILGFLVMPPSSACAQRVAAKTPYDLTKLRVVNNVLAKVRTRYVEPRRLHPKRMLRAALKQIQLRVPEVIVRNVSKNKVEIQVNKRRQTFSLAAVDSPWALSTALRTIFRFLQANLHPETKRRDVEYAAVDGLLKTLDCHSVLLRPEFFGEMQIHTRGSFGGLGITISRCGHPQVLTVVKPIEGTPAYRAGLRAGDQIVRIGKEPTANLTLNEAVKRLRGRPGSRVQIWVRRKGAAPRPFSIERARIMIRAVDSRMLKNGIGYVRIKSFQSTTDWELRIAIQALQRKGLRGLVLDLRGNGGGLLSKAISVADTFLYSGTVVTTVEHGVKRRESRASWSRTLAGRVPLAVLVDGGTASASEIVAGALKNLDRAVIIGQRTYGKGSVQVIYPNRDRSGFKVTIAQYLTPGDRSIQGIGVIPDIQLMPVEVKKDRITYFSSGADLVREGDRTCSLRRASLALHTPPKSRIHHLAEDPPRGFRCEPCGAASDWKAPPDPDQFQLDYPIRLASKVVQTTRSPSRRRVLAGAKGLLATERNKEESLIARQLKKVAGVDWSAPPANAPAPRLTASVSVGRGGTVKAGSPVEIAVTVTNAAGAGTAYQVHGLIYSTNPLLQHRELFVGRLDPGKRRTVHLKVPLSKGARPRTDELAVKFFAAKGAPPPSTCTVFRIEERAKPKFVYTRQLIDDIRGNGDGQLQPGESVRLRVQVRNVGKGTAEEAYLRVKSLSGDAVSVRKGVFVVSGLKPGASRTFEADFTAMARLPLPKVKLLLSVTDCTLGVSAKETLVVPVAPASSGPQPWRGVAQVGRTEVPVFQSPRAKHVVAWASPGARLGVEARLDTAGGAVLRVSLGKLSSGFVRVKDIALKRRGRPRVKLRWRWLPARPEIRTQPVVASTDKPSVTLQGTVTGKQSLTDVYVSVQRLIRTPDHSRIIDVDYTKVFYQAADKSSDKQLSFRTPVPLWRGSNLITITARAADRTISKRRIRVLRTTCRGGRPTQQLGAVFRKHR